MYLSEIREQIGHIPAIHDLSEEMRKRTSMIFLGVGTEVTATDGQVLFTEGDTDNDVAYVLLSGKVLVEKVEMPPITAFAPEVLGELVKFSPMHRRSATVRAEGDVKLLKFTWSDFFGMADKCFTTEERLQVQHAVEDIAWTHFTV